MKETQAAAGIGSGLDHGFKVPADQAHEHAVLDYLGGLFRCKLSANDTDGALCIFDTLRLTRGGPGKHVHHKQDEWFYVTEGEFLFEVGDDRFVLGPGDSAFGPRGVPHAFAMTSEGPGRMLILYQPAGQIEAMFEEEAAACKQDDAPADFAAAFAERVKKYDIDVVGPPLDIEEAS